MTATDTYLLLRALCDEFARCGMRHACTSPGSRNTPLVLSLVGEPRLQTYSHIDERCAGFFALGAAKTSGLPVAVTCTSGSAAANLAPAVIEAFHARVPLIVLTADRPPELRQVGAGQTIDQIKLYGDAAKWFFEVGVDTATPANLRWIRMLAARAYWTALAGPPGPVHLNFPLREPLVLEGELPPDPVPGRPGGRPWVTRAPSGGDIHAAYRLPPGRTVIVAGAGAEGPLTAEIAARAGIPLLADPLSGARRGPAAVAHYDLLLRSVEFAAAHRPQTVVRIGELPTSKPLRRWLTELDGTEQVAVDPDGAWQDPDAVVSERVAALHPEPGGVADPAWLESWRSADAAASAAILQTLAGELSEPAVAAGLARWLGPADTLFIASSMPVRDVEEFAPVSDSAPQMLSNRGTNGIDGTVSAAFGSAAVSDGPVVLLVGDVALAHDIGGLLAARRLGLKLTIVLLHNDGGGIFHFLPVANAGQSFIEHVATPHGLDFAHAAALYDCTYQRVATLAELERAVRRAGAAPGTVILEVRTDREQNLALHRRVADAALGALSSA